MGAQQCAEPLMYQQLLYPRIDDIDKYLAMLLSTPQAKRVQTQFAPAWKARRYELEVLADRAAEKHNRAMRIGVIHDTTSFKGVRIPRKAGAPDAATEHVFELKMRQVLIQQTVLHTMKRGTCPERVMQKLMEYLAIPVPWHPDQPHLAEWQAFSTREIIFNIDQSVEARNMAQKQAAKYKMQIPCAERRVCCPNASTATERGSATEQTKVRELEGFDTGARFCDRAGVAGSATEQT